MVSPTNGSSQGSSTEEKLAFVRSAFVTFRTIVAGSSRIFLCDSTPTFIDIHEKLFMVINQAGGRAIQDCTFK